MSLNYLLAVEEADSIQVLEDNVSNVPELIDNCVTQNIVIIITSLLEQVSVLWPAGIPRI